jgi:hypothetical protein
MNQNLDLLRQNYCRPAIATGKGTQHLFPLEKECEQGKTLLAKMPKTFLQLQEFSPYGLHQTYREKTSGLELPVFGIFDLEGDRQVAFEITTDTITAAAEPRSLPSYMPLQTTQTSVRDMNVGRIKSERVATRMSVILGILPVLAYFFSGNAAMPGVAEAGILVGGWVLGAFLIYVLSLFVLDRICPWKKLALSGEFDGILPKQTREKALEAKKHFDKLYVVIDQQNRWKSSLLPDPRPRALDPLLIGELKLGRRRKFFLIDQFDLTDAERYLADEFATKPDESPDLTVGY